MIVSEKLVLVNRGPITESLHRGHAAVCDANGRLIARVGDPDYVTFARSSAKLLQAIPVVETGAAERFGFEQRELALLCSSHNGEETHVETACAMLSKIGLPESALQCGPHDPYHLPSADKIKKEGRSPSSVHNNCSGKHSGMLALSVHLGAPVESYLYPEHPVQRLMRRTVAEMCDLTPEQLVLGTDGCGVPVFGMPLSRLAQAFARFGAPLGLPSARAHACTALADAIRSHPHYLAGSGRLDTRLVEATGGRMIGKMGAEGVFAITVPDKGIGIALKIEDGASRAINPAAVELLRQLGLLTSGELEELREFHRPALKNWAGTQVGEIVPSFTVTSC